MEITKWGVLHLGWASRLWAIRWSCLTGQFCGGMTVPTSWFSMLGITGGL